MAGEREGLLAKGQGKGPGLLVWGPRDSAACLERAGEGLQETAVHREGRWVGGLKVKSNLLLTLGGSVN